VREGLTRGNEKAKGPKGLTPGTERPNGAQKPHPGVARLRLGFAEVSYMKLPG